MAEEILKKGKGKEKDDPVAEVASRYGLAYRESIKDDEVDPVYLEKLPLGFVKTNRVFPLRKIDGRLLVAIASPSALFALDDVARFLSVTAEPVLVPTAEITSAINRFYERLSGSAKDVMEELEGESLESLADEWQEPKDLLDLTDEAPIIKLLNSLLFQAVKDRASDIHIEPFEKSIEVRFRVDGILYPILAPPKIIHEAVASRVKIMAGLDIAEKRLPQDGRIRLLVAGKDIDVRVSIVPTAFGERVVLRILDRKVGLIGLSEVGLKSDHIRALEGLLKRSKGIILVTGPTGSGKTTTLYASVNRINSRERNIITVEDPIEYQLAGVGQIQVNPKIGLTFANGLRSILRQDPDVIMVGEIRDRETAEIAIQASLTGHLVLSTLHTNDAPTAVTRLVDMGVEPFLLSSSLTAAMAQRLVRVLCRHCKAGYAPEARERSLFRENVPERLYRAAGCERCFNTGYYGQTGIFEFMPVDQTMRVLILKNPDSTTLKEYTLSRGIRTMRDDGLDKAAAGITSIDEVIRVTQEDDAEGA